MDDFNSDGRPDVVVLGADSSSGSLAVLLGDGTGGLAVAGSVIPVGVGSGPPGGLAAADFDSDGKPDVVVVGAPSGSGGGYGSVLLGDGNGGFTPTSPSLTIGEGPSPSVVTADFNADGRRDLAVITGDGPGNGNSKVTVFLGDGSGWLAFPQPEPCRWRGRG